MTTPYQPTTNVDMATEHLMDILLHKRPTSIRRSAADAVQRGIHFNIDQAMRLLNAAIPTVSNRYRMFQAIKHNLVFNTEMLLIELARILPMIEKGNAKTFIACCVIDRVVACNNGVVLYNRDAIDKIFMTIGDCPRLGTVAGRLVTRLHLDARQIRSSLTASGVSPIVLAEFDSHLTALDINAMPRVCNTESAAMQTRPVQDASVDVLASSPSAIPCTKDPYPSNENTSCCVVCFSEIDKLIAFIPCGHACCCKECADHAVIQKQECPLCRVIITSSITVFVA